jgi:hypothetical protein
VAQDAHKAEIAKLLEEERLTACAQLIYSKPEVEVNIWIGDEVFLNSCSAIISLTTAYAVIYESFVLFADTDNSRRLFGPG